MPETQTVPTTPLARDAAAETGGEGQRRLSILVADDERSILVTLRDALEEAGHEVLAAADGNEARLAIEERSFDVVVTDLRMPGLAGLDVLGLVKARSPTTEVIVMTGQGTVETAVKAMQAGAYEYLLKPFPDETLVLLIDRIRAHGLVVTENRLLKEQLGRATGLEKIVGASRGMREVFQAIRLVAGQDVRVLVTGETGTGKELVARALHNLSPRRAKPFVAISCASVPETLLEDTLFGHEKGAFTDAAERRVGRFEYASGGTILLDDIDDMPLRTQVKLLRVLQEAEIERLGGTVPITVDVRVIAASKVDLLAAVDEGRFRRDLYYRLNVVPIRLPPLRDREDDLLILAQHFLEKHRGGRACRIDPATLDEMARCAWPGNVRELEHSIERAVALADDSGVLRREHILGTRPMPVSSRALARVGTLATATAAAERFAIRAALDHTRGHKAAAARALGISRKNLWDKMRAYGIE